MNKEDLIEYIIDEYVEDDSEVTEDTPLISGGIIDSFSIVSLKTCGKLKKRVSKTDVFGYNIKDHNGF